MSEPGDVTKLLRAMRGGDQQAASRLWRVVYSELHLVAARMMQGERPGHTLQPTAVVHEAYMRLIGGAQPAAENRPQFFALAARAMRQVLVDHARRKLAEKRGGAMQIRTEFEEEIALTAQQSEELLAIHEALERLEHLDNKQGQIVEMHYFSGSSVAEIAIAFDIGERTVKRELGSARLFLRKQLESRGMTLP
jgi:RNA polymerase sigma factor (TIGR02999 family)